jgi:L-threonylcarbamoyladenylate synthase
MDCVALRTHNAHAHVVAWPPDRRDNAARRWIALRCVRVTITPLRCGYPSQIDEMLTEIVTLASDPPTAEVIARAAVILRAGGLVAFPTETVYGLGANALDPEAVSRIFTAKGRPANNPLIVHLSEAKEALRVAAAWPASAARLAEHFWPGPLTLVLPKRPEVPDVVTAGGATVAVRVPAHPVAQALLRAAGMPVAAPSANRSGYLSPTRAEHVLRGLDGRIDMILDGGPVTGGIESTVLDVTTDPPRLLRPGLVSVEELQRLIGPVMIAAARVATDSPLPSPGMLTRHYAPRTPLELAEDDGRTRVLGLRSAGVVVGWLPFSPTEAVDQPEVLTIPMPLDPAGYAAKIYAALHMLDEAGVQRIVVALPPDQTEWLAVRDRLRRAAEPEEGGKT